MAIPENPRLPIAPDAHGKSKHHHKHHKHSNLQDGASKQDYPQPYHPFFPNSNPSPSPNPDACHSGIHDRALDSSYPPDDEDCEDQDEFGEPTPSGTPEPLLPPVVTITSLAVTLELLSRLRDLKELEEVYIDFDAQCADTPTYIYLSPPYISELRHAISETGRFCSELAALRMQGEGTETPTALEETGWMVCEMVRSERERGRGVSRVSAQESPEGGVKGKGDGVRRENSGEGPMDRENEGRRKHRGKGKKRDAGERREWYRGLFEQVREILVEALGEGAGRAEVQSMKRALRQGLAAEVERMRREMEKGEEKGKGKES